MAERFLIDFKRFFFYGLAAVLPTLLTLAVIFYVFTFLNTYLAAYVNDGARWVLLKTIFRGGEAPAVIADAELWSKYFWWLGFLLSLVAIYIFGRFVASLLGRSVWRMVERAFFRMPVVKQIYPYVKQVTDFLFGEKKLRFSRVVVVEYPRKGIWSLGLVTGAGMQSIGRTLGEEFLTVFVPSSPTPLTGYVVTVRRDEVLDLPISIDDAIRFVVSGGVIMPVSQLPSEAEVTLARKGKQFPTGG